MAGGPDDLFKLGVDVLAVTRDDATNTILVQLGDVVDETASSPVAEWKQHVGFCSLPSAAAPGKEAAQAVCINNSSRDICIASSDNRAQQLYANLRPGETCIYAGGADGNAQGRVALKADGSVVAYTTDTNAADGRGVYLAITPTELRFEAPWGRIVFNAANFSIVHHSGARLDMGGVDFGQPAPLDQISSYATLSAKTVKIEGPAITIGNGPAYLQCAVTPTPVAAPNPVNPTGGSGSVLISAT